MAIEIKVCNYDGSIREFVRRYSTRFQPLEVGEPSVRKWFLPEREEGETYLVMVSKCWPTANEYNTMISVAGPKEEKIRTRINRLEQLAGVKLQDPPEHVKQRQQRALELLEALLK